MPLMFNSVLRDAGLPLADVRLLRHKDKRADRGYGPYELWRDDPPAFEWYQATQQFKNRAKLAAEYWASFVGTSSDETLFVGLYRVKGHDLLGKDTPAPHIKGEIQKAGTLDVYELTLEDSLRDLIGRLLIDWGKGALAWVQNAQSQNKVIKELWPKFKEREFPGFLIFCEPLSKLDGLPKEWISALSSCRGVYILTCPKTREQYVGSATGVDGFWGRWLNYLQTGHGGNVGLKSKDPSDYQVSILEVAGTAATPDDILQTEQRWKSKLKSREMGLNKN